MQLLLNQGKNKVMSCIIYKRKDIEQWEQLSQS